MPLTLVTGLPGHGKTLYSLARWKEEAEKDNRPVFHNGINGLNLPNWQIFDPEKWEDLPPNALVVLDECQKVFPVRGRGQPPSWIENLSTHRHLGIDFVLITQNPMLMDSFVRRLVDRHFHIVRKFGTHFATIHEFVNGCKENVDKSREGSIRHEWKFPKSVFDWYKSAEVHTVKRRVPAKVWLLLCIPFILAALVLFAYQRLKPSAVADRVVHNSGQSVDGNILAHPVNQNNTNNEKMTASQYLVAYTPRIPELPHTAPVYDEITKPVVAPYPAACISSSSRCKCYSQQATVMNISIQFCRQIVERGFFMAFSKNPDQPVNHESLDNQKAEQVSKVEPYQILPDPAPRVLDSPVRQPMQVQSLHPLQVEKIAIR